MNFEKRNNIYIIVMTVIITVLVTFILTAVWFNNYYSNKNAGIQEVKKDASSKSSFETKIDIIKKYIDKYYIGEVDEEKLEQQAIKGYVDGLEDIYSEYLTESELQDLMVSVQGNFTGIGIYMTIDKDENIIVLTPIEDSPAEKADLKTGDIISKVNGEECKGMDLTLAQSKIKGEEGTIVELEIIRDNQTITKTITRENINIKYVYSTVLEENIGYIQILAFDDGCAQEFEKQFEELKNRNIKSLIIDIRDNGGGVVEEVIKIANLLTRKDDILMVTVNKNGEEKEIKSSSEEVTDIKIAVLINGNSASASEILAGALKDNGLATLVGEKTYGKGVMQEVIQIATGGALKVTMEEFKTPNRNTVNKVGIEPDIVIENQKNSSQDLQLKKALELLK